MPDWHDTPPPSAPEPQWHDAPPPAPPVPSQPIIPSVQGFANLLQPGAPSGIEQSYENLIQKVLAKEPEFLQPITPRTIGEASTYAGTGAEYGLEGLAALTAMSPFAPAAPIIADIGTAAPYVAAGIGGALESRPGERWQGAEREMLKTGLGRGLLRAASLPRVPFIGRLPFAALRGEAAALLRPAAGAVGGRAEESPLSAIALEDAQQIAEHILHMVEPLITPE